MKNGFESVGVWGRCRGLGERQEEPAGEAPTFSPAEIEAAFDTCRAYAREAAELRQRFPMKYSLSDASPSEQLERCVLSVLRGDTVQMMPLG